MQGNPRQAAVGLRWIIKQLTRSTLSASAPGLHVYRPIDPHYQRERYEVRRGRVRHREVKSLALRHMQPVRGWQGPSPGCLTTEPAGVPAITPLLKTLPLVGFWWWLPHSWTAEGGYQIWQLDLTWSHIFHVFHLCNPHLPKRTVSFWILTFTTYKTQQNWGTAKTHEKCVMSGVKRTAKHSFSKCCVCCLLGNAG